MKDQFFTAIKQGNVSAVQSLLSKNKLLVKETDENGRTGLHIAAFQGNEALVNLLLANGAAIEAKEDKAGATPLHMAVQAKQNTVVGLLLSKKANVNATMKANYTALHLAVSVKYDENTLQQDVDLVVMLLRANASREARTEKNCTPLHLAAQGGHHVITEKLLNANVEIDARQKTNWTPMHFAAQNGRDNVVRLLAYRKANVNAKADNDITPLHLAAQNGQTDSVKILLDNAALIESPDKEARWTPLCMAVKTGHLPTINLLLNRGASVTTLTKGGNTVLHLSALHNQPLVTSRLLAKDPLLKNKPNSENKSAMQLAKDKGNQAVVSILETNQATQIETQGYQSLRLPTVATSSSSYASTTSMLNKANSNHYSDPNLIPADIDVYANTNWLEANQLAEEFSVGSNAQISSSTSSRTYSSLANPAHRTTSHYSNVLPQPAAQNSHYSSIDELKVIQQAHSQAAAQETYDDINLATPSINKPQKK